MPERDTHGLDEGSGLDYVTVGDRLVIHQQPFEVGLIACTAIVRAFSRGLAIGDQPRQRGAGDRIAPLRLRL